MAKIRRRLLRALSWAALFVAAAVAGIWVGSELGPDRLRREAEHALAGVLGETRVGSVTLGWAQGLSISARDIQVLDRGAEALLLRKAELRLDLLQIFRGGGRFDRLRLEGLVLHLHFLPDGRTRPARVGEWLAKSDGVSNADAIRRAGLRALEIRDAKIWVSVEKPGAETATLLFEDLALRVALGDRFRLEADGQLAKGTLRAKVAGSIDEPVFNVALEGADLSLLNAWVARVAPDSPALGGRVNASFRGRRRDRSLELDLFSIGLASARADDVELPALQTSGRLHLAPDRIRLVDLEATIGELAVRGEADLPRPLRPDSLLSGALRAQRLPIDALCDYADRVGLFPTAALRRALPKGASFDAVSVAAQALRWDALDAWLENPKNWPEGLRLEAALRADEIALGEGEPIRDLSARFALDAETFSIDDMHARLGDRPLPNATLEISSWSRLAEAPERPPVAAVPPLYGREALTEWLKPDPDEEPAWRRAYVEFDWLDHPALLRPLSQVAATLTPLVPGVEVELHRARWGEVWVSGSGKLSEERGQDRILMRVETHAMAPVQIGDPIGSAESRVRHERDAEHWASGRAVVDLNRLGPFSAREIRGPLRAKADRLISDEVNVLLEPRGRIGGNLEFDLSVEGRVPYRTGFQLSDGDLATFLRDLSFPEPSSEGRLVLGANVEGHLQKGESLFASMRGPVSAHARDGVVYRRVPWAFAIAAASETLNPFRSRESLRYKAWDSSLFFDAGRLEVRSIAITGPRLRMVATGTAQLAEPYNVELVTGLFFFRGIDRVLGGVPILNTLLLGSDENLVSAYFSLEGPWSDPKARLVPIKTFLAGPASIVVEGVPNFVRGGLDHLGRLFSLKRPSRDHVAPETTP